MSEVKKRKVIAVGDYLKQNDNCVPFTVPNPENPQEIVDIFIRIKNASPRDQMKTMDFVHANRPEAMGKKDYDDMSDEEKASATSFSYLYDAQTASSCAFHPPADFDPDNPNNWDRSQKTPKVWETMDDCLDQNTEALFSAVRLHLTGQKVVLMEGEAKK
jgi:hypothetical protein